MRKLGNLVQHLPPESATATAMRLEAQKRREESGEPEPEGDGPDPSEHPWSQVSMLLAAMIDELRVLRWVYVSAHSKSRPPVPQQVRRPGVTPKDARRHRSRLTDEQRRMLDPRIAEEEEMQAAGPPRRGSTARG